MLHIGRRRDKHKAMARLRLRDYHPVSQLHLPEHEVPRAGFAAVDAHAHLGRWLTDGRWAVRDVGRFVDMLDACNVATVVNLDGRWGAELAANLARYDHAYAKRFITACHVDWAALEHRDSGERLAADLERSVQDGARGLKVWKDLGLRVRDGRGRLVLPDDDRLAPLWETAGLLHVPVIIHTADPLAFFEPVDNRNERLEELLAHPDWSYSDARFPRFAQLIDALEATVRSHPATAFIGVHVGCYAENLARVADMLDRYPNYQVDIAARIAELGRQPRASRALITQHPDRVLFGTDGIGPEVSTYHRYFRFLETADEQFPYSDQSPPPTGRWAIAALDLPPDVLEKVYAENAARLWRAGGTP